jgi:hypothetical protein
MLTQGRGIINRGDKFGPVPPDVVPDKTFYYLTERMKIKKQDQRIYAGLADNYIEQFLEMSQFDLMAAGYDNESRDEVTVHHLWQIPDANEVWHVMERLGESDLYCRIDDLVSKTRVEEQDVLVGFGSHPVNTSPPTPLTPFKYITALYNVWTSRLSGWDFEFDAGFPKFQNDHPTWTHLGNRLAITGALYNIVQHWVVPDEPLGQLREALQRSDWAIAGYPAHTITLCEPTSYDTRMRGAGPAKIRQMGT